MDKVKCPECGKELSKAGYSGHMRFKHGTDPKYPLAPRERPLGIVQKAQAYEALLGEVGPFVDDLVEAMLSGVGRVLDLHRAELDKGSVGHARLAEDDFKTLRGLALQTALSKAVVLREAFKAKLASTLRSDLK